MAQRPNSERNLYGPPKFSPHTAQEGLLPFLDIVRCYPPAGLLSQANDFNNQWVVNAEII
jgi:hypothetical protein